jgi:hypothetical protein
MGWRFNPPPGWPAPRPGWREQHADKKAAQAHDKAVAGWAEQQRLLDDLAAAAEAAAEGNSSTRNGLMPKRGEQILWATEGSLITSAQIDRPPVWAATEIEAGLAQATVVFVGIGDVASYVRRGLNRIVAELGPTVGQVFVVSPSIETGWDQSAWSELLPGLPEAKSMGHTGHRFSGWARPRAERRRAAVAAAR